jgi:hypothetical protein
MGLQFRTTASRSACQRRGVDRPIRWPIRNAVIPGCEGSILAGGRYYSPLYVDPQTWQYSVHTTALRAYCFLPASALSPSTSAMTRTTATFTPHGLSAVMPCSASSDTLYWFFQYDVPILRQGTAVKVGKSTVGEKRMGSKPFY